MDSKRSRRELPREGCGGPMSTNYEPKPEQVEREAAALHAAMFPSVHGYEPFDKNTPSADRSRECAKRILQRQHSREKGLLDALKRIHGHTCGAPSASCWKMNRDIAASALAAHAALDAPPEPTLLEAAKALVGRFNWVADSANVEALDALKAAVEREESRK